MKVKTRGPTTTADPLVRECPRCGEVKRHAPRSDDPGKPKSMCPDCLPRYLREWRAKNWRRAKARNTWKDMIRRCHDPGHGRNCPPGVPRFSDYGARGITVCRRWRGERGFEAFLEDLGLPPSRGATLDRKNPKRNYTPSNCRWTDPATQARNRRTTRWVVAPDPSTGEEVEDTLTGWAARTGIKRRTIGCRLKRGWSPEDAVSVPVLRSGETLADYLAEIACPF